LRFELPANSRFLNRALTTLNINSRIKTRERNEMSFILGKKFKMTQIWKDGKVVPVTVVLAQPNKVSFVRTKEKDGYEAVQVSHGRTKIEFRNRPANPVDVTKFAMGDAVTVGVFKEGDKVRISGYMKGRGFAGVVKRYNFRGGPQTHGQKNRLRHAGSIGSTAFQRVVPGRRMAGHMGTTRVTIKNLVVAEIDAKKNLIYIRGAVPGARGGMLEIRK
jgi:large subunit ribosomal protein L3